MVLPLVHSWISEMHSCQELVNNTNQLFHAYYGPRGIKPSGVYRHRKDGHQVYRLRYCHKDAVTEEPFSINSIRSQRSDPRRRKALKGTRRSGINGDGRALLPI